MREIVLDTETTGLDPAEGHRIVEIGAVELFNHVPTGATFHRYLNPERDVPPEAVAVHGLSAERLAREPRFAAVAEEFVAFLGEARLVIHNAAFDLRFLNAELARIGRPPIGPERALDTLEIARRKFPGAPASLDALCRRFGVDASARTRHGALLDCELLAEVYLHLVGGRQTALGLDESDAAPAGAGPAGLVAGPGWVPPPRPVPLPPRLSAAEAEAHRAFVASLGAPSLWD